MGPCWGPKPCNPLYDPPSTAVLPGSGFHPSPPSSWLRAAEWMALPAPSPQAVLSHSPFGVSALQIPDKQYVLTALAARAKLRAWHDVDALFTTKVGGKTFLGGGSEHWLFPDSVEFEGGELSVSCLA